MGSMHVAGMTVDAPVLLDGYEALDVCHRQTLAMLERLSALVGRLGAGEPDAPARLAAAEIVQFFSTSVRAHHEDEERHVFPRLLNSGDGQIVQAVRRLQQDHGWLEEDWRELSPLLEGVAGAQGWVDLELLRRMTEVFVQLSHEHMALEESLIYPRARAMAPAGERRAMVREMMQRRREGGAEHAPPRRAH